MSIRITGYQGVCDKCGEPSPEVRSSNEEAQRDSEECPCREEEDAEEEELISYTEIERNHSSRFTRAPNGSSEGWEYWTSIVQRQDWADDPRNGLYAGRSYRVTSYYCSCAPDTLGVRVNLTSQPF